MLPLSYLQVKYKEAIGQGTPISDLPEVKRVKETQKHISSVVAHMLATHGFVQPAPSQLLPSSISPLLPSTKGFPCLGDGVNFPSVLRGALQFVVRVDKKSLSSHGQRAGGTWLLDGSSHLQF